MGKPLHKPLRKAARRGGAASSSPEPQPQPRPAQPPKARLIDGYKDPAKVYHKDTDEAVRERIRRMHERFPLPESVASLADPRVSDVLVINRDARRRDLLPDVPPRHVMLCHGSLARAIESGIGIFARITTASDGSWTLCPAAVGMLNRTTVQHVRRRRWWWLRRYGYEISFDGHVEPAMMLHDYGIDPTRERQRFLVSRESVPIRGTDRHNTFFRFWLDRKKITHQ